jgi:hypothetical protein
MCAETQALYTLTLYPLYIFFHLPVHKRPGNCYIVTALCIQSVSRVMLRTGRSTVILKFCWASHTANRHSRRLEVSIRVETVVNVTNNIIHHYIVHHSVLIFIINGNQLNVIYYFTTEMRLFMTLIKKYENQLEESMLYQLLDN